MNLEIPIDVMVVGDSHGGTRPETFREQLSVDKEVNGLGQYYLHDEITKFHQYKMRELFNWLSNKSLSWVFTDLIKCFVCIDTIKAGDQKFTGTNNLKNATKHCRKYLDSQIELFKPKIIISLGKSVSKKYFEIKEPLHAAEITWEFKGKEYLVLHSTFPGRSSADAWAKTHEWYKIKNKIQELTKRI